MQLILFVIFLIMYTLTVLGNTTLIVLICSDSRLHTPMYFFIGNLSFLDLWLSTVYTPKILVICVSEDKSISFAGCVAQFFFSAGLDYTASYMGGFINSSIITKKTFTFNFCNNNAIDDFFCDLLPLVKLACGGKEGYQALMYFLLNSNVMMPIALILASSYLFIIATILRI
ncbi:Olfactory receptor 9G1 [Cricetulus griseus]|uniref:Olfactory receptor 9G1 n=1 Tax=Cricetulus griseus TaxID=10029 RepID=G3HR26_CRIGR|nr:Olfactory receptor 9G1 [Cricetulus griseus]